MSSASSTTVSGGASGGVTKSTAAGGKAGKIKQPRGKQAAGLSTMALAMMNVTIIAGLANDVQQSFYGLASVTYFVIGGLLFFLPTGLVAAELASGWSQRGGIFRWVGEGIGTFPAIACLLILWFQTTFTFGSGIPSMTATIGFFTTKYDWAVWFAENSHSWKIELPIMCCWLAYYWIVCWLATKGVKVFSKIAKYGVILGTFLPLSVMTILAVVWLCEGHTPAISINAAGFVPKWAGMSSLAMVAGVFFSYAGIDMNAAHIKDLKHPNKQYPAAIFISMILCMLIFIVGTVIIAIVIPEKQINLLYTLYATYRDLGAAIGFPDLYLVFCWLGMLNSFAALITNLAGPSYMLGQAGRSGFLPKALQNNNKHGMPSRLMYVQMAVMTVIAFIVFLLPNVEGFVELITQAITILYMAYYVLMFVAFLRLRYTQPNRPRGFRVPGGKVGAWIVAGIGIVAATFGIVIAFYPPSQLEAEVGSGFTYDAIIIGLLAFVILACVVIYRLSRKRNWVDPSNEFAPFTWQIEGLKKPGKVLSNVPTAVMSEDQNPMGMPIKHPYDPNEQIDLPDSAKDPVGQAKAAADLIARKGITLPSEPAKAIIASPNVNVVKAITYAAPEPAPTVATVGGKLDDGIAVTVPRASAEAIAAQPIPADLAADEQSAMAQAALAKQTAHDALVEEEAYEQQAAADEALAKARQAVKADAAAAAQAKAAVDAEQAQLRQASDQLAPSRTKAHPTQAQPTHGKHAGTPEQ
ncbi:APC family permease [Bifidobacterium choloepi]|uniref:Amino acid permease n=1 Tax=Bifidobacterium choloepi TaxID=2614131 RepID=A0A6I5N1Q9_9BIFI|nr:APC family permease [Bifidobacterium choloepi]NEG70416.1 amino acid permease [Bifidobacterium choloepi]